MASTISYLMSVWPYKLPWLNGIGTGLVNQRSRVQFLGRHIFPSLFIIYQWWSSYNLLFIHMVTTLNKTTLNKTINKIRIIFSYFFKTKYICVVFSHWMSYLKYKLTLSESLNKIYFSKLSGQLPLKNGQIPSLMLLEHMWALISLWSNEFKSPSMSWPQNEEYCLKMRSTTSNTNLSY